MFFFQPLTVEACMQDKSSSSSSLKTQALLFLRSAMAASDAPAAFQPSLPQLLPPVLAAAGERYYKVRCWASAHGPIGSPILYKLIYI